jgi:AbrB family looped-hinge helix DNA binding protein
MAESTRLTGKGQATIPKPFREKYGLTPGDELVWQDTDDGLIVQKRRESARGALVPEDTSPDQREDIAQALEQRLGEIRERNQPPGSDDSPAEET